MGASLRYRYDHILKEPDMIVLLAPNFERRGPSTWRRAARRCSRIQTRSRLLSKSRGQPSGCHRLKTVSNKFAVQH
jgi:hypothetical protein